MRYVPQSLRSRLAYELNDSWQVRHTLGVFTLDSDFDNTCAVSYDPKTNKVGRQRWQQQMGWYAETGLTLVGERYADNANTVALPGYGRWDALAGFRQKEWDVRAALNNISDKTYYASATSAAQIQFGDPRSLVVTGTYSF
ncbi:TonB-dependent receptor domain-containing protein [Pseudomonas sp. Bout1]|uniref:TonB-dependent receptor domain-containing protein n=1 Tax=Pseudomonas sp. Bout1 TaxID=3048600 RepID=UPI0039FDB13E